VVSSNLLVGMQSGSSYQMLNVKKFYSAQSYNKRPTVHYNSQQHERVKVMQ